MMYWMPPSVTMPKMKLQMLAMTNTMMTGMTRLKDWATAGGTPSGILIRSFSFLPRAGMASPTSRPTIRATNRPCAPIKVMGRAPLSS